MKTLMPVTGTASATAIAIAASNSANSCMGCVTTLACDNCTVVELAGTNAMKHCTTVPAAVVVSVGVVGRPHVTGHSLTAFKKPDPNMLTSASAPAASGGTGNACGLTTLVVASMASFETSCVTLDRCTSTHVAASTSATTALNNFMSY